jgi:hypothetical protein
MKKQFLCCLFAIAITTTSLKAQQMAMATTQATEKKQPNVLTKLALLKLSATGVSNNTAGKAFPVFFEYYSMKQKIDAEMAATNTINATAEYEKIISTRDDKLRQILSETEMKNFKKKLEAELAAEESK